VIDKFGSVIEDVTESMKAVQQKNEGYGTFCKNNLNLNAVYGKDEMSKSKYRKLVVMDRNKTLMV
jgi:hypothetical protein